MKLNVKAFALTCGILWGASLFLLTWWIILWSGAKPDTMTFIRYIYRGYAITPMGSVIGLVWAFFDGLIGGAIFAWLYNLLCGSKE